MSLVKGCRIDSTSAIDPTPRRHVAGHNGECAPHHRPGLAGLQFVGRYDAHDFICGPSGPEKKTASRFLRCAIDARASTGQPVASCRTPFLRTRFCAAPLTTIDNPTGQSLSTLAPMASSQPSNGQADNPMSLALFHSAIAPGPSQRRQVYDGDGREHADIEHGILQNKHFGRSSIAAVISGFDGPLRHTLRCLIPKKPGT